MEARLQMRILALAAVALSAIGTTSAASAGNVNFVLGPRDLDGSFWTHADDQVALGLTLDIGKDGSPLRFAVGVYSSSYSSEEDFVDLRASLGEVTIGLLQTWNPGRSLSLYGGLGLAAVLAETEVDSGIARADDDLSGGYYAQGGLYRRIGRRLNVGVDARVLRGTNVSPFGNEGDADYSQVGLLLGWGWPP